MTSAHVGGKAAKPASCPAPRVADNAISSTVRQSPSNTEQEVTGAKCLALSVLACYFESVCSADSRGLSLSPERGVDSLTDIAHLIFRG